MFKRIHIIAIASLSLTIGLWMVFGLAAYGILNMASKYSAEAKVAMTKASQISLNQRIHSLAESTQTEREKLSSFLGSDIVSIIDIIDAAGKSAGVDIKVENAAPEGVQKLKGGEALNAVVFSVEGGGSYANLMHVAELYENLPLLSSIEQLDIEKIRSADSRAPAWHMTARIRVLTAVGSL